MDKQTLSNYGWIVICILVLCVMIALATPFGNFIASGIKSTAQGLFDVNQKAFNNLGFGQIPDQSIEDSYNGNGTGGAGDGYDHNAPELHPDDGTTPANGDTYEFGDYIYTYQTSSNGWAVAINTAVTDRNQTEYGPILESINGEPVTDMGATFSWCAYLTVAPVIPSSVTNMNSTFEYCSSLTTAPVIPNGVTDMGATFWGCTSLTVAPVIPNSVTKMNSTFCECSSLTTAPVIPGSVTNMCGTFYYCTSLKTYTGNTDADGDFSGYVIPNGVTNMEATFCGCALLTTAPVIPSSVTDMTDTFEGCTSLTGTITINATPTDYDYCLTDTQITEILGSCGNKDELLATKYGLGGGVE